MTVANTSNEISYLGGGSTAALDFPYRIDATSELYVYIVDDDGTETLQSVGVSGYSVALTYDFTSAAITPSSTMAAAANGKHILLRRTLPFSQPLDLENAQRLNSSGIDGALDRAVMRDQQLSSRIGDLETTAESNEAAAVSAAAAAASATAAAASAVTAQTAASTAAADAAVEAAADAVTDFLAQVGDSINTASDAAGLAAASAASAEADAIAAASSAATALAAAEASGDINFYNTKSAANSALAGLTEGQIVEVLSDESREHRVTRYKVVSSAYVFQRYMPMLSKIFIRGDAADDTGDGLTWNTAKKTLAAGIALLSSATDEIVLGRGSVFYNNNTTAPDFAGAPHAKVRAGGQGDRPVIDGSTIFAGAWTQPDAGTYPNLWKQTITFTVAVSQGSSNIWGPAVYDEGDRDRPEDVGMTRHFVGGTLAINWAAVNADPGSFTCNKNGDTTPNPQTDSLNGTTWDFYIHTRDGSNPNSNDRILRTVDMQNCCYVGSGQDWSEVVFRRTGSKDFVANSGFVFGTDTAGSFTDCDWLEASIHGAVVNGACFTRCKMYAGYHGNPIVGGGGAFHQFRPTSTVGMSKGFLIKDCLAKGFSIAAYSHEAGANPDATFWGHPGYDIDGLTSIDCRTPIGTGVVKHGLRARRVYATGARNIASLMVGCENIIEDSQFFMSDEVVQDALFPTFAADTRVTLRNCLVHAANNGWGVLQNIFGDYHPADPTEYHTLTLEDSTVSGGFVWSTDYRSKWNLYLTNSYFGIMQTGGNTDPMWILGDVTADATSVIETAQQGIGDVQAAYPDVDDAVMTGVVRQVMSRVVAASDMAYFNSRGASDLTFRTATYTSGTDDNGDDTSNLNLDANDAQYGTPYGRYCKIVDAYGSGDHYFGTILNPDFGGSHKVKVTPVPDSSFSNKTFLVGAFGRKLYTSAMETTVKIAADGSAIRITDTFIYDALDVGTVINISPITGRSGASVPRIITAKNNTTKVVTLDRPVVWKNQTNNDANYDPIDGSTSNDAPLPTVTVSYGFPIARYKSAYPKYTVTPVEGGSDITGFITTTSGAVYVQYDTTGHNVDPGVGTGHTTNRGMNQELGTFDVGFMVSVGDVLKLETDVAVVEHTLAGNLVSDITNGNQPYALKVDGEYARRGVGFKPNRITRY